MIRAGTVSEIRWGQADWLVIDIGFSSKKRTCGVIFDSNEPRSEKFSDLITILIEAVRANIRPLNIIIEAPLSVSFSKDGNPKARSIEHREGKNRGWHYGSGATTLIATMHLMEKIQPLSLSRIVNIYEGFVSYKSTQSPSNHDNDVALLCNAVKDPTHYPSEIIPPEELKKDESDILCSAFKVAGMDFGIPPVIYIPTH